MPSQYSANQFIKNVRFCFFLSMFALLNVACSTGGSTEPNLTAEELLHRSTDEMELTWQAAMVRVPSIDGTIIETTVKALESGEVVPDQTYPVVIWMHGCNGFWSGTNFRINWLASNGFVVVAPLSFARTFYPQSCNVNTQESGLYRPTLGIRQYDAGYAINKVREFDWADKDNLILAGLSEGAAVVTTYIDKENPMGYLKARVAESWGCHAGWSEFEGLAAPASEAVLTLVSDQDPWYTASFHQGDCGEFMNTNNGSLSYVVDYAPLRTRHELWENPEIQEIISTFLLEQVSR